jgi:hypothetical protein
MAYTDIDKPSDYFNTSLWTGDNNARTISGVGFQPDWVWEKCRSNTYSHILIDSVRGITKQLSSNAAATEATDAQGITAFNSDGYVLGTQDEFANNGNTFVAWNWKAGTSFTNDASGTGIGSIDSAGSFNNDSGFSIVSYTGTGSNGTLKHGLNSTPSTIIVKERGGDGNWIVYHSTLGNGKYLSLTDTGAAVTASNYWNNTSPTSSVFTVGTTGNVNGSSKTYIAYCFAEKQGYSKFGSYVGNGNADGTFVYTGFKPAFVMIKATRTAKDWKIIDNKRNPSGLGGANPVRYRLAANTTATTSDDGDGQDFTSQGFKFRTTDSHMNGNGTTYMYMAFAENPFVSSSGVPATAR